MAFKKIVVPVTGAEADLSALAGAFAAARPFCAHVQALFVYPDPREAVPFVGMPVAADVVQQIIDNAEELAKTAQDRARANTEAAAKDAAIAMVEAPIARAEPTCSFRVRHGGFLSTIVEAARLADLLVFGPSTTEGGPDISGAFIETLTKSMRPVLLAPATPVTELTRKIVIGWDGGAAAAHALSAALPLLEAAGAVELYTVKMPDADAGSLDQAVQYLALHGIAARSRVLEPGEATPGEALLHEAETAGASLLVLGGYGHSRVLETLFGGTTVHVAGHATLPLFMVH